MPFYRVWMQIKGYETYIIEAENRDEAEDAAFNCDGYYEGKDEGSFEGDEITDVVEIEKPDEDKGVQKFLKATAHGKKDKAVSEAVPNSTVSDIHNKLDGLIHGKKEEV